MRRFVCSDEHEQYQRTISHVDASAAAEEWAEHAHDASGNDWREGVCRVQEIDENDHPVGGPRNFNIEVDWSPSFSASEA